VTASLFEPPSFCESAVPVILERLFEKVERAKLHGFDGERHVTMAGHDDDRKLPDAGVSIELAQQFHAVHARHPYIRDHASGLQLRKLVQKNLRGIEQAHAEAGRAEQEIQRVAHRRIVVDDVNLTAHQSHPWPHRRAA
jgi:hypothetical protein